MSEKKKLKTNQEIHSEEELIKAIKEKQDDTMLVITVEVISHAT